MKNVNKVFPKLHQILCSFQNINKTVKLFWVLNFYRIFFFKKITSFWGEGRPQTVNSHPMYRDNPHKHPIWVVLNKRALNKQQVLNKTTPDNTPEKCREGYIEKCTEESIDLSMGWCIGSYTKERLNNKLIYKRAPPRMISELCMRQSYMLWHWDDLGTRECNCGGS